MPPNKGTGSASTRSSIREAFNATVEGCNIDIREFAQRVSSSYAAITQFQDNTRELTSKSLDQVLGVFSTREFLFFLDALATGETQDVSISNFNDEAGNKLIQHPAFYALVSHNVKNCNTEQYHELLCILADNHHSSQKQIAPSRRFSKYFSDIFCPARISVREALNATIDSCGIKMTDLAQCSKVPDSVLSRFRSQHRELRTKTLDQILQALPTEQYLHFIGVLKGALDLLMEVEPALANEKLQDDPDHQFRAFCTLLAYAARQCTDEEYEDLFCLMTESRRSAKNLDRSVSGS